MREQQRALKSMAVIHLKEWKNSLARGGRNFAEFNGPEPFYRRALDLTAVKRLKVVQVPQLAGLADSLAACEPLPAVKSQAVIQVVVKPAK